jgi:TonB-linked SusC/RagA family outer membrane protein
MMKMKQSFLGKVCLLALFVILTGAQLFAQKVTGVVVDDSNTPLPGVTVVVKGTTNGVITNNDGNYSISTSDANKDVLLFSFIGFETKEVKINGSKLINVQLKTNVLQIEEVVAVGYGVVKKRDVTGSVASVSGKAILATPAANVMQAMQGKLAGVNIITQDGRPDAAVSIRVRGGGSISQSNDPLILVDGVAVSSLSDIPAYQIESIDVLKDASSTAIYGARGANGVILVTTKSAKAGKPSISFNSYMKLNTPTKYLKALNPYDYLKNVWANSAENGDAYRLPFEQLFGIGSYLTNNPGGIDSYKNMATDDVQKDVYNSSVSWNHNFSITGGTDQTKILFSVNYLDEEGMKINSYAKRANISLKVNQKITDNVDFSLDTRFTNDNVLGNEGTTSGSGSILSSAYRFRPISTAHILGDLSALTVGNIENFGKNNLWDQFSPVARTADYDPLTISSNLQSMATLNWHITKAITFHTDFNYNKGWGQVKNWGGAIYNNYIDVSTNLPTYAGAVDYTKSDSWGMRWSNTVNFNYTLANIHKINFLIGNEVTNSGGSSMRIQANRFPVNFTKDNAFAMINQYDQATGNSVISSSLSMPSRIMSVFARANYSLMDRYLFTATFRADGSSRFTPQNRWGYFPAGAFAWRLSEEPFMKPITWIDNLKVRLSYGSVGNDNISSALWSQLWKSSTDPRLEYSLNHQLQSSYDYASSSMANLNLKWETTITRGFGVDFAFFKNKLTGTVDLYSNTTKDLLMQTANPAITGFTTTFANIGQTSNKGVELSLTGTILKNKDWEVTANANININRGNVDQLAPNVTGQYGTNWASSATYPASDYIFKVGSPVGLVRGLTYTGFYTADDFTYANGVYTLKTGIPDLSSFVGVLHGITGRPTGQYAYPGLPKFKDQNVDGVINDLDLGVIGNMNPVHTGGFNFNVTYKNFDFGAYFNWSYGNQIYNVNKLASMYGPKEQGVYDNKLAIMNNAYKIYDVVNGQLQLLTTPDQLNAANVNATLPLANGEEGITSTLGIENGSYLRLNTLTLGYTLPKTLTKKAGISSLRIYGSIYNVMTITGYSGLDPEVNANTSQNSSIYPTTGLDWGTYPRARSFTFGINLNF